MSFAIDSVRLHCTAQTTITTPLGRLLLARSKAGLAGAWFDDQKHHVGTLDAPDRPCDPLLQRAADQLGAYFAGEPVRFDVPLDLQGTPFQQSVWRVLLTIGAGVTRSYGDIARQLGVPAGVRAVGSAVGRNPVSVIVPCHRVVGGTGALTGYAGGLERKRSLLLLEKPPLFAHEGHVLAPPASDELPISRYKGLSRHRDDERDKP